MEATIQEQWRKPLQQRQTDWVTCQWTEHRRERPIESPVNGQSTAESGRLSHLSMDRAPQRQVDWVTCQWTENRRDKPTESPVQSIRETSRLSHLSVNRASKKQADWLTCRWLQYGQCLESHSDRTGHFSHWCNIWIRWRKCFTGTDPTITVTDQIHGRPFCY